MVGKILYVIKGNYRAALFHNKPFDIIVEETKVVKACKDPMLWAGTVDGWMTDKMVISRNWFTEDWLDYYEKPTYFSFYNAPKNEGTQTIITMDKSKIEEYKKLLMEELRHTVVKKRRKVIDKFQVIEELTENLDMIPLVVVNKNDLDMFIEEHSLRED